MENDRRVRPPDRRRSTRNGRRASDPSLRCTHCGLVVHQQPHGSDAECVMALRAEVNTLRAGQRVQLELRQRAVTPPPFTARSPARDRPALAAPVTTRRQEQW